jgi:hypothetical protein
MIGGVNAAWVINMAVVVVAVLVAGSCFTNVFNRLDTSASIQLKMIDRLDSAFKRQDSTDKNVNQLRTEMDDANYRFRASDQQFGQLWNAVSGLNTRVDANKEQIGTIAGSVESMWEQGQHSAVSQKHTPNKGRSNGVRNTAHSDQPSALAVTIPSGSNKGQVPSEIDLKYVIAVADYLKKQQDTSGEGSSGGSAPNTNAVLPKQEEGGWFWSFVIMTSAKAIGFIGVCMFAFYFIAQQFAEEEYGASLTN